VRSLFSERNTTPNEQGVQMRCHVCSEDMIGLFDEDVHAGQPLYVLLTGSIE